MQNTASRVAIYVIQHIDTLDIYVGQTRNPPARWSGHRYAAKKPARKMLSINKAMHTLGVDFFTFKVIEWHDTQPQADEAEDFWIEFFGSSRGCGYNKSAGGLTASRYRKGHAPSETTLEKLRTAHLGQTPWNKGLPKERQPFFAKPLAAAHRRKLSEANRGGSLSDDQVCDIRRAYLVDGVVCSSLAQKYNLSEFSIREVARGRTYAHVPFDSGVVVPTRRKYRTKKSALPVVTRLAPDVLRSGA